MTTPQEELHRIREAALDVQSRWDSDPDYFDPQYNLERLLEEILRAPMVQSLREAGFGTQAELLEKGRVR